MTSPAPKTLFEGVSSSDFLSFAFGGRSYSDQLQAAVAKTGELCAVKVDERVIAADGHSHRIVFIQHDFRFMGGSLGCAEGEKIVRGFEHAQANGLPVVLLCQSGGARMQEGTLSLMQLAKVSVAVRAQAAAGLPFISLLIDPTYGGVSASYAMQADVRIGVKGARIGFAGPAVILNTMYEMDQAHTTKRAQTIFSPQNSRQARPNDMVVDAVDAQGKDGAGLEVRWKALCARCFLCSRSSGRRHGGSSNDSDRAVAGAEDTDRDHSRARAIDRYQPRRCRPALLTLHRTRW